jgi:hypothetical protein
LALLKLRIPAARDRSAQEPIELPEIATPQDALTALRLIVDAAARGQIDGDHARALTTVVEAFLKTLQLVDLDDRIRALESAHGREARREAA